MESNKHKKTIPAEYGRSFKKGRVILSPESPILEFKDFFWPFPNIEVDKEGNPSKKIILLKTICGFLNHQGGTILIGVKDDKEIKGVTLYQNQIDQVKQYVNDLKYSIFPKDGIEIVTEQLPIKDETKKQEKWIKNLYVIRIQVQQGHLNRLYTFKFQNQLHTSNRSDARSAVVYDINEIQDMIFKKSIYPNKEVLKQEYLTPDPEGLSVSETRLVSSQISVDSNFGDVKQKNGQIDLRDFKKDPSLVKFNSSENKPNPPKQEIPDQPQQQEDTPTHQKDNPTPGQNNVTPHNIETPYVNPDQYQPQQSGKQVKLEMPEQVEEPIPSEINNKQKKVESPLFIVRSQEKINIVSRKIDQKFNGDIEKKPKLKMVLEEVALVIGKTEKEIEFFQLLEQKNVVTSGPSSLLINLRNEQDINLVYDLVELYDCEATILSNNNFSSGSQMNEQIIGFIKKQIILPTNFLIDFE